MMKMFKFRQICKKMLLFFRLVVSMTTILYPIMLQRVYSVLFVLYALHNKKKDAAYWERLMKWNKQPDVTLMAFLGVEK